MIRDVHKGFTTRRAALGAADLERPAGGDRRPLAGIFRVRVVPGKSPSGCHTAVFWVVRELLGSLGGFRGIVRAVSGRVV